MAKFDPDYNLFGLVLYFTKFNTIFKTMLFLFFVIYFCRSGHLWCLESMCYTLGTWILKVRAWLFAMQGGSKD